MGRKIFKLDDTEVSIVLVGMSLAHSLYNDKKDIESMKTCDRLFDLMKVGDLYVGKD